MKTMTKHMDVSVKDIKEHEFQVFSLLEFNLYLPRQEFLPHFEQILYRQGKEWSFLIDFFCVFEIWNDVCW